MAPEIIEKEDGFVLQDGEQLLWSGRPLQGVNFNEGAAETWAMICIFPVAIGLLVWRFVLGGEADGVFIGGAVFFLSVISLYQFILDPIRRWKTRYALTDRRLIIAKGKEGMASWESVPLNSFAEMTLKSYRGGSGTITLGRLNSGGGGKTGSGKKEARLLQIYQIEKAGEVLDKIWNARRRLKGSATETDKDEAVWTGQPEKGYSGEPLAIQDIVGLVFSSALFAFVFWLALIKGFTMWFLDLFALIIFMNVFQFLKKVLPHAPWMLSSVSYIITPERLEIVNKRNRTYIDISRLPTLGLDLHPDGSGTIALGAQDEFDRFFSDRIGGSMGLDKPPKLEMLADARMVYDLLEKFKKSGQASPASNES